MIVVDSTNPQPYKYLTSNVLKDLKTFIEAGTTISGVENILKEVLDNENSSAYYSRRENKDEVK